MSTNSAIEWTDCTWNPVVGCTRVSAGCDNCYAVPMTYRMERMARPEQPTSRAWNYTGLTVVNPRGDRHFNGVVRCVPEALEIPLHWKQPRKIFVNSMSDLFHPAVPFDFIDKVLAVMALCPQHAFQVLTKRPERMAEYFIDHATRHRWGKAARAFTDKPNIVAGGDMGCDPDVCNCAYPLPNVWLGTSCEDQATADERIPHLLKCPAAVRGLSLEPLLGPIDLNREIGGTRWIGGQRGCGATHVGVGTPECPRERHHHHDSRCNPGINWVIVGGESGPGARPCNVDSIRSIIKQCKAAGVPCFVKQLGAKPVWNHVVPGCSVREFLEPLDLHDRKGGDMDEWPEDLRVREFPGQAATER